MSERFKVLSGYDDQGVVHDAKDCILRHIFPNQVGIVKSVYDCFKQNKLSDFGVVQTDWIDNKNLLKHKKYPISYPYEWTCSMIKDVALFHLELFNSLDRFELTLKDASLSNIVFDYTEPKFVDFFSIVPKNKLENIEWLSEFRKGESKSAQEIIFEKMVFPYILIPVILLARKEYYQARDIWSDRSCNVCHQMPSWSDLFKFRGANSRLQNLKEIINLYWFARKSKKHDIITFYKKLSNFIRDLNVVSSSSNYSSYYIKKQEDFSFENKIDWKIKQKNVYSVIEKLHPKTVLDLGANTGWYSILAEKEGAKVIAIDIDEMSIDLLYRYAKSKSLKILSLFLPFDKLNREIFGKPQSNEIYKDRDFKNNPIYLSPTYRLKSELVLCLALFHHLVLGDGMNIGSCLDLLSKMTEKRLVLEFIDLEDPAIKNEPTFFKNLEKHSSATYNLDVIIQQGLKFFNSCEILNSHPETRSLIVFEK
jgi:SAM-dependent methyltransferase